MIHNYCAELKEVLIRPLHRYDIEYLRKWRNNGELSRYLRNIGKVDKDAQIRWYEGYLKDSNTIFFAIDFDRKKTVGSLAIYNFNQQECEIGKIVIGDNEIKDRKVAERAFLMAMGVANHFLGIDCFKLSVHEDNKVARHIYTKLGFEKIGEHPFPNGGKELEMVADIEYVKGQFDVGEIVFFEDNSAITQNWSM
ncbi:MAG: GNAT family N-acetyltransferase [Lachnospiraceae bacterium]|nr:GNAT family N-acetyltransferase [Lachnospiraceae bacterium]